MEGRGEHIFTVPPLHGLLVPISSNRSSICTIHRQDSTYHGLCYTNRGALAGTRNRSMDPPRADALPRSYISLPDMMVTVPPLRDVATDYAIEDTRRRFPCNPL